jgi:hypothetical protein
MIGHLDSLSSKEALRCSHTSSHPFSTQCVHYDTLLTLLCSCNPISLYFAQFHAYRSVSQPFAHFWRTSYISQCLTICSPTLTDIPALLGQHYNNKVCSGLPQDERTKRKMRRREGSLRRNHTVIVDILSE